MELMFIFVNQTKNKFIEKQGFNFSPNYKFEVTVENDTYTLRLKERKKKIADAFFDDTGCISNITAVVGENGSGKSSLLNELCSLFFAVKDEDHESAYNAYFDESYTKGKRIAVFMEEGELICFHNIDQFKNETEVRSIYLYQGSPIFQEMITNNTGCENISKIYITNSKYSIRNNVSTHINIGEIFLNVDTLNTLKDMFYKRKIRKNEHIAGGYYSYLDICRSQKKSNDFQQILDVLYIQAMYKKGGTGILSENIQPDLYVSFQCYTKVIQEILNKDNRKTEKNNKDILVVAHEKLRDIISDSMIEILKTDSICMAYFNLLYEIIVYRINNDFQNIGFIASKSDLKLALEYIFRNNSKIQLLFGDALNEIKEFEDCLQECPQTECLLPIRDMAFDSQIEIKYGSDAYTNFLNLIEKYTIQKRHSFILKYIHIDGLHFSSGERALLNFFSWMYLVPFFKYISDDVQMSIRDNVLLLIDEIDLYCHPGWQQKMIYYLIDEARMLFHDKKVQIIFTTHSPIILSDMPKSNIIYLVRDGVNNKCRIDESEKHDETFGANIYKLFNDAFFLEEQGQVGEFAKRKIRGIIDKLKPEQGDNGKFVYQCIEDNIILELEQEISLIGEPIIKDRLYTMLYKHKIKIGDRQEEIREKMIKVYEEKIKQLRNEENR